MLWADHEDQPQAQLRGLAILGINKAGVEPVEFLED
jgi:hypothetical protein